MQLKSGTHLQNGKYKIERVLGQGGFGITYLATQELLDRKVCIKEFFFKEYCDRTPTGSVISTTSSNKELVMRFLNKFIKEARTISRLDHSNIIRILDVFEENGTAYYVMEYIDGCSLEDKVNRQGVLNENEAVEYVKQVGNALDYIHQNRINHLDVKPANIMIRKSDNKATLIDFGVSKQYDEQGGQTSTTPVGISYGYAPLEQYRPGGVSEFSPQADIYSLGATLYRLLTGKVPPQAMEILNDGLVGLPTTLSSNVTTAIQKAMQLKKDERPQNMKDFLKILNPINNYPKTSNNSIDEKTKIIGRKQTYNSKPKFKKWILLLILAIIGLGVGGYYVKEAIKKNKEEKEELARINKEKEEQAYKDKDLYLSLICEGDTLLNNNKFDDAISKYEEAETYRDKYLYTEYSGLFNISTYNKITAVDDAEKIYKEKQARDAEYRRTHGTINGYEWVDLGLPTGIKWATCNIGADKPENYGNYYAWGEISTNSDYTSSNCITYSKTMSDISGDAQFDAARANWKGSWRMPTQGELEELKKNCTWNLTARKGVLGYEVKGCNGNSIFLPFAGYRVGLVLYKVGEFGYYWSSTPQNGAYRDGSNIYAYSIYGYRSYDYERCFELGFARYDEKWSGYRYRGLTIRPVTD